LELNFAIDNVNKKRLYETQDYLESRATPTSAAICPTTMPLPTLNQRLLARSTELGPSFSAGFKSTRVPRIAGASPKVVPVTSAIDAANDRTRLSIDVAKPSGCPEPLAIVGVIAGDYIDNPGRHLLV
jgi:hypothetical protein